MNWARRAGPRCRAIRDQSCSSSPNATLLRFDQTSRQLPIMKSGGGFRARAHGDPTLSSRYSKFSSGQSAASVPRRHVAGVVGKQKRNSNESATQVRENTASQTPNVRSGRVPGGGPGSGGPMLPLVEWNWRKVMVACGADCVPSVQSRVWRETDIIRYARVRPASAEGIAIAEAFAAKATKVLVIEDSKSPRTWRPTTASSHRAATLSSRTCGWLSL